jgi:PIN domain nuclease of toxin-antitoxin system
VRILLDTDVWLWMIAAPDRLSDAARRALEDQKNELFLSVIAAWEIGIRSAAGKLKYTGSPAVQVPIHIKRSGVILLPISVEHALAAAALPMHHDDMIDRLLVAQAEAERMTLATANSRLHAYGISTLEAQRP